MKKKKKKLNEMTKEELASEKARVDKDWAKLNKEVGEAGEENYSAPINYTYLQFFIGETNVKTNKQKGKPNVPPY